MEQIRRAFWAGLFSFVAGAALLAAAFFLARPPVGVARTLHNVLSLAALLLAAGGGFLAVCTGPVLLAGLLSTSRARRRKG